MKRSTEHSAKEELSFYKHHLEEVILPFWKRAVDEQYGGVYTCFNNTGDVLTSRDKYTWSQGRFLWIWSKIAGMIAEHKLEGRKENYLDQLSKTALFLEENVFLENGNCAFLLTEEGKKKESISGKGFDTSIYADCFVALGLAKYAGLTKNRQRFENAERLYTRIRERIETDDIPTEPYPIPEGYRAHSIPMIMLNVSQELNETADYLNHPLSKEISLHSISYMRDIMDFFLQTDHRIIEMLPEYRLSEQDTLLYHHVNPGHAIESMWFVIHTAQKTGHTTYLRQAVKAIEHAIKVGWDREFGGLLRFTDKEGGMPEGRVKSEAYEQLITDSWELKLWWPHAEALYATFLASKLTDDRHFHQWYREIKTYTFNTFPNPDKNIGEWIQIQNRQGEPVDKIAALPVKDPFHIARSILMIIDLLEDELLARTSYE